MHFLVSQFYLGPKQVIPNKLTSMEAKALESWLSCRGWNLHPTCDLTVRALAVLTAKAAQQLLPAVTAPKNLGAPVPPTP